MTEPQSLLDLRRLLGKADGQHLIGSLTSADLNVNLLAFTGTGGVEEHVNSEVDVLVVAMAGEGLLTIDDVETRLTVGLATVIPKGARRSIQSNGDRFAYLTCHGIRQGMMPKPRGGQGRRGEASR